MLGTSAPPTGLAVISQTFGLRADVITADGDVLGWAYTGAAPPVVTIHYRGAEVAHARACLFRPDLLQAGYGHGHYSYRARLRRRFPAGRVTLTLTSGAVAESVRLEVPPQTNPAPCTVEALVAPPPTWTLADLLACPGCLPWAEHLTAMGTARFIDAAFRFVLHRWPSDAESRVHARALARGTLTGEALITRLLRSHERAGMEPTLMSPYDPDFLFDTVISHEASPGNLHAHAE